MEKQTSISACTYFDYAPKILNHHFLQLVIEPRVWVWREIEGRQSEKKGQLDWLPLEGEDEEDNAAAIAWPALLAFFILFLEATTAVASPNLGVVQLTKLVEKFTSGHMI
ncbi:hypothetical protein QN277_017193 [Acacia crassicarpa]|uniref:Uncharacterized protein n=1 Tax=Acacia crassicarpa TaxID=499986 RepID=A0AAE1JN21_9FABA|nr:hypothetical protein QN277_017193 [Acacia crassicarpa]